MNFHARRLAVPLLAFTLASGARAMADPLAELAAFSSFKTVNLDKLAGGAVQAVRGAAMSSPRGLAVESCYVVRKPLAKTVELHLQWNPGSHSDLKVWLHGDLPARPAVADFQKLQSAPGNSSVRALAAATQKMASGDLQLSAAEAKAFDGAGDAQGGSLPPNVRSFWGSVLLQRSQAFLSGGLSHLPPYEMGGETIRAAEEASRLLKEAAKVRGQFAALIDATPLGGEKGSLAPSPYWELIDVEGCAALNLGALYSKQAANSWQAVDVQYYSSGGYCVLLTFYQAWPVSIGGQDCTLVWRGDLISSRALASLHGVERMGSSTAMMRETQKFIERFLGDAAKPQ